MQTISAPMTIEGHELLITTSIGGCVFPADGNDPGTLLKNADTAMYHAKTTGRSNFQRSEEHTSELQSLMRISYAVFCLKKKKKKKTHHTKTKIQKHHTHHKQKH